MARDPAADDLPGVNLVCAASFIAAVGNPHRFLTSRKLVAYLGLDPRVKQSGEEPARSGRISKRGRLRAVGAGRGRLDHDLQPGPVHAFYERIKASRGHGKAIVATARKLAILFWCMLTRAEDYAHQQPSLTAQEAPPPRDHRRRSQVHPAAQRDLVHQRPRCARRARARTPSRDLIQADGPRPTSRDPGKETGASATPERAYSSHQRGQVTRQAQLQRLRFDPSSLAPAKTLGSQHQPGKTKENNAAANTGKNDLTFLLREFPVWTVDVRPLRLVLGLAAG